MQSLEVAILKSLYITSPQSIAELSQSIGKSVPNITNAVNKLLTNDLISNKGLAPSTGGRRAAQYIPNIQHLPKVLCVAIDQFYTSVVVSDFSNQFITEVQTQQINYKSEDAYQKLIGLIKDLLKSPNAKNIYAIGVTLPGFVDSAQGINNSFSQESPFYNLQANLHRDLGLPIFIENDSTAIAIAEHKFGIAKNATDVMVVNLNWGVGLGMILDNELYRGHSGYAGEFSHIPLSNLNKLCSCGKKGCLEVEASLLAGVDHITERLEAGETSSLSQLYKQQKRITGEQLLHAAILGDQLAIESIKRIGYMLGKGIATLIHIINPEMVVISGRGAKARDILYPQITSALLEFSIQRLSKNTVIEFSTTNHIQLIGSACISILRTDRIYYKQLLKQF